MTRFLITLDHGVKFVLDCIRGMAGGEIFIPKIPSVNVMDLARVIGPDCKHEIIGIRPGEKLHETLVPEDDARLTIEFKDRYVIQPIHSYWHKRSRPSAKGSAGKPCADGFRYSSDTNTWWLKETDIRKLVAEVEATPSGDSKPSPTEPRLITGG